MTNAPEKSRQMTSFANLPAASLKGMTVADLRRSLQERDEGGQIAERARQCLYSGIFYEPEKDNRDRATVLLAFTKALRFQPFWAVLWAFDEWEKTQNRRPAPGDIRALSDEQAVRVSREIERRQRAAERYEFAPARTDEERRRADETLQQAGFNARRANWVKHNRMATSEAELAEKAEAEPSWPKHWTDADIEAMRKLRGAGA